MASSSVFELLQKECERKIVFKKLSDLQIGEYPITKFQFVKSLFGTEKRRLAVVLNLDGDKTISTIISLPDRFLDVIKTDEQVAELNSQNHILVYKGIDTEQKNKYLIGFEKAPAV